MFEDALHFSVTGRILITGYQGSKEPEKKSIPTPYSPAPAIIPGFERTDWISQRLRDARQIVQQVGALTLHVSNQVQSSATHLSTQAQPGVIPDAQWEVSP